MDLVYVTPWVVGAIVLHDIPGAVTLALVPVLVASWWQDWLSARAATAYFSGELVGFDILTAGNYIGLVDAWRRPVPADALVSTPLLVHWTGVFVIYIAWNLTIIRQADPDTRSAFIKFSLWELPIALLGIGLVVAQVIEWTEPHWLQPAGVATLAVAHVTLLVTWRLMSRKEQT